MCHRTHSASSDVENEDPLSLLTTGSALVYGAWEGVGDTELCFSCHGVAALGSVYDVESPFEAPSTHSLAPSSSAYGPPEKQCASCHDTHGTSRDASGATFAALLRSDSTTSPGQTYYQGDVYCASCHQDRAEDVWDGLEVWNMTGHATEMTPTSSGTQIVCSNCHHPHGSDNSALIQEVLYPPAAPATVAVPANDRWLCFGCHPGSQATYSGGLTYQASTHGTSTATVTVDAEWASAGETRTVGECQSCHSPMGRSDGAGGTVAKLAHAEGKDLCFRCHGLGSQIASDLAQFEFPASEAGAPELMATYDADELAAAYSRVAVYTQESTGTAPRDILGPREYDVTSRSGDAAAGDIDGDGVAELVVGDPGGRRIDVFDESALAGLDRSAYLSAVVQSIPTFVAVGDVLVDGSGLPEIITLERPSSSPASGTVEIYRWNGSGLSHITSVSVGNDPSGLAVGDVAHTSAADIVVTSDYDDELRILTQSGATTFNIGGPYATRKAPRGPSVGDAWDGAVMGNEITVANSGESTGTISVFSGAGALLGSYDAAVGAGGQAWETLVADVLPNVAGQETAVALRSTTATSGINVFTRLVSGGLGGPQTYVIGQRYGSGSLASGDIDGDSTPELVVGNGGVWSRTAARREPSLSVFEPNGTGTALSASPQTLWGGGAQLAGRPPAVVIADVGAVGESRHAAGSAPATHVSTETATLVRHVECADCHNVHEATSTPTLANASAPAAYGPLLGTWGVEVENAPAGSITLTERRGVLYEYETCLKCHSAWSALGDGRDIASEIDTRNASVHAIEETSTNSQATSGSFVSATPAWSNSSILYCADCHANQDLTEPVGPHTSENAPILARPYWGVLSSATNSLCYECHKSSVYLTGVDDGASNPSSTSRFYNTATSAKLHSLHTSTRGYGCETCHMSHGIDREHLIRNEVGYSHGANGGSCNNACHSTGVPTSTVHAYTR
jgi:predicted CXXCH cytochrome family protein